MKMSWSTRTWLWLSAGMVSLVVAGWMLATVRASREDPRSEQYLVKIAADINRSLPTMIDKETELLPMAGAPGMLIYSYRLVNFSAAQINHEKFAAAAKQQVVQGACGRPETRDDFLKKGVKLRYSYFDRERKHIATVDVTPADCGF
jgi:hypothetical protein